MVGFAPEFKTVVNSIGPYKRLAKVREQGIEAEMK